MKKIVLFGGGTGLSTLLTSLKKIDANLTIGVAITDNGGSTGKIREYYDIPAPGDLRRVILELSDKEVFKELFNYRFDDNLEGHTIGNLMLTALTDIEGNMNKAVQTYCKMLGVKHNVHPISNTSTDISAWMSNNNTVKGEVEIVEDINEISMLYYNEEIKATKEILESIEEADLIVFSCGSLYTSLIVNLILPEVKEKLKKTKAKKIYIANVMTQKGETDNYKLSDHINSIQKHTFSSIIDYVIVNNNYNIDTKTKKRYEEEGSKLVEIDKENIDSQIKIIEDDFIIEDKHHMIRHNTEKLKKEIEKLL